MTACTGSTHSSPTTTADGASAAPAAHTDALVLRLGTDDNDQMPGAQQIKHYAEEVARLSGDKIRIEPVWHADGGQPHWDQAVATMLLDGELDMAMIPSRAWDDLGVDSLRVLTAPFLITTDTLVADVVADPELVDKLTSGLSSVDVTALGLYPEGLRHPFGVDGPLLGAEDYQGGVVHAPWSRTANAMFESLGATTDDGDVDPTTMIGSEASYRLTPGGTATGNVVFYPKVNVLSVDSEVEAGLSEEQRGVLREAADATAAWVEQTLPDDAEAARTFCDEAGQIAGATRAQVDSLVAATRDVVDDLREEPTTAALIDAITSMAKEDPEPERVTSCPEPEVDRSSELNGTYTFTATAEAVRAAGGTDQGLIDENTGDFTVTFVDGTWLMDQVYSQGPNAGTTWHGTGGYTFDGKDFQIFYSHEPGSWTKARVKIRKDGSLVFTKVDDGGGPEQQALSDAWYTTWPRQDG
jgi:TRAP-type C4-dicarboxylate transport system substrate-binding protein